MAVDWLGLNSAEAWRLTAEAGAGVALNSADERRRALGVPSVAGASPRCVGFPRALGAGVDRAVPEFTRDCTLLKSSGCVVRILQYLHVVKQNGELGSTEQNVQNGLKVPHEQYWWEACASEVCPGNQPSA